MLPYNVTVKSNKLPLPLVWLDEDFTLETTFMYLKG